MSVVLPLLCLFVSFFGCCGVAVLLKLAGGSRYYRAPELIFGATDYGFVGGFAERVSAFGRQPTHTLHDFRRCPLWQVIDIWSMACVSALRSARACLKLLGQLVLSVQG